MGERNMKNVEIIKQSLLFPIRYYKHFAIVTLLFLIAELVQEHCAHHHDSVIISFIVLILPLIALGINLQIIFHAIKANKGFPKLSLRKALDESVKDTILESYYLAITIIITVIIVAIIAAIQGIVDIPSRTAHLLVAYEHSNVIEIIGSAPQLLMNHSMDIIVTALLIFILILTVMFTFCTIGKVDLEVNHNFRQILDLGYIGGIVGKIGVTRYLQFLALVMVLCIIISNIIVFLEVKHTLGCLLSSLLEAFSLFFFLHAFSQLYPE